MNENKFKYDAFISYRHCEPDKSVAERLHKMLEAYKAPAGIAKKTGRKKIQRVFRDREELPTSSNLADNIQIALENSEFLIVICSPRTPQSQWVAKEIETFSALHGRDRILALLVEGEPYQSFPDALRFIRDKIDLGNGSCEDIATEVEPLAADIRAESLKGMHKKLKLEILRLLAPVFGCAFDDLRQRQRERAIKRILTASVSLSVFFLGFGSFSAYQAMQIKIQSDKVKEQSEKVKEKSALLEQQVQKTLRGQSMYMANISNQLLAEGDRRTAVMVAREALPRDLENPERPYVEEAEYALSQALQVYKCDTRAVPDIALKHDKNVNFIKFSPDGKTAVTSAQDGCLYIWDTGYGKLLNKYYMGYSSGLLSENQIYFIDDHTVICPGGYNLVCLDTGSLEIKWTSDFGPFNMAVSADRTKVALADAYGDAVMLDAHTGEVIFRYALKDCYKSEESPGIYSTAMDETGRYFAVGMDTGDVLLFDTGKQTYLGSLRGKYGYICDMEISGSFLALATDDFDMETASLFDQLNGTLDIFDLSSGKIVPFLRKDFDSPLDKLEFDPYDKNRIVFTRNEELDVLNIPDNTIAYTFTGGDAVTGYSIKDGFIVTASRDGTVRFLILSGSGFENAVYRVQFQDGLQSIAFDSGVIAVSAVSSDKAFILRNVRGSLYEEATGHTGSINGCDFSPDGNKLLSYTFNTGEIIVWDWKGLKSAGSIPTPEELIFACFVDNGNKILASFRGGTVAVYDAETLGRLSSKKFDRDLYYENISPGRTLFVIDSPDGTEVIRASDFSTVLTSDGTAVFYDDDSKVIMESAASSAGIYDTKTGKPVNVLPADGIRSIVPSGGGKLLAYVLEDNSIHIVNAGDMKEIRSIGDYKMAVDSIRFSPDGGSLFIGLDDFSIRRYDIEKGVEAAKLDGHEGLLAHIGFSPDNSLYVTVDENRDAIIWKSGTNKKIGEIPWFACISPDFGFIISSDNEILLRIPVYTAQMLADEAEKQLGGVTLTDGEREDLYILN